MRAATEQRLVRRLVPVLLAVWFAIALLVLLLFGCWRGVETVRVDEPRPLPPFFTAEPSCHALRSVAGPVPAPADTERCYALDESAAVYGCLSWLYSWQAHRQAQWIAAAIDACADEEETPRISP